MIEPRILHLWIWLCVLDNIPPYWAGSSNHSPSLVTERSLITQFETSAPRNSPFQNRNPERNTCPSFSQKIDSIDQNLILEGIFACGDKALMFFVCFRGGEQFFWLFIQFKHTLFTLQDSIFTRANRNRKGGTQAPTQARAAKHTHKLIHLATQSANTHAEHTYVRTHTHARP